MSLSFSITNPFFFSFSPILWLETWLKMFIFTQNRSFNFFLFFYHSFVFHHFLQNPRATVNFERVFSAKRWFLRIWSPKRSISLITRCHTFFSQNYKLLENCEHDKMPKFDELSKNHFIFMSRSLLFISRNQKWLKMIKNGKNKYHNLKKWLKSTQISWFEVIYNWKNPENWDSAPEPNSESFSKYLKWPKMTWKYLKWPRMT